MASLFLIAVDVAPNHPQKERWKVAFRSMFLMEFDGKELLFVERTIAISIRVLG